MTCKICSTEIKYARTRQEVCSVECAIELTKQREKKKRVREWNKTYKEAKEKIQPIGYFQKQLETEINKIIRVIDYGQPCISCGGLKKKQAGHYHSVGANGSLRYNLHNIHVQDVHCNEHKSANIIGYDEGLIATYGREYWGYVKFELVRTYTYLGMSIPELKEATAKAREILRGLEEKRRPPSERLALRDELQKKIGIY